MSPAQQNVSFSTLYGMLLSSSISVGGESDASISWVEGRDNNWLIAFPQSSLFFLSSLQSIFVVNRFHDIWSWDERRETIRRDRGGCVLVKMDKITMREGNLKRGVGTQKDHFLRWKQSYADTNTWLSLLWTRFLNMEHGKMTNGKMQGELTMTLSGSCEWKREMD